MRCGTGSSADLQVIKRKVNPRRILAHKCNRQRWPAHQTAADLGVSCGPDWDRTSDLPRVRRFIALGICVSAGQSAADGPDWTCWSTCS